MLFNSYQPTITYLLGVPAIFCLTILFATSVTAQSNASHSKVEAELVRLEQQIGEANIRRDKKFFQEVEADEFIFTDSNGGVTTKAEDVASLDKPVGEARLIAYKLDDIRVRTYGSAAIVFAAATSTYKRGEQEILIHTRFTDVFVKTKGRWRIVAGHSSRVRDPQK